MDKKLNVEIPTTVSFIRVGGVPISISEFTDEELKEIGKKWTKDLLGRATAMRSVAELWTK